jgi:hypothetical protein
VSFERAFTDVERAAASAITAAQAVVSTLRGLEKAAKVGDIAAIERASHRLDGASRALRQQTANARQSWPYSNEQASEYLESGYTDELESAARSAGLALFERDGRLIAFPSVLRVLPSDRAVRVDRTKVSAIRPSRLVSMLRTNQQKKAKLPSERFLETLYRAYTIMVGDEDGRTVLLADVYDLLTLRPGSQSDYDASDFVRDVYALDRSGIRATRGGAAVSLPASTGTKGQRGVLSFVSPDGESVTYYGLRFEKAS